MRFSIPQVLAIVAAYSSTVSAGQVNALAINLQNRDAKPDAGEAEAKFGLGGGIHNEEALRHEFSGHKKDLAAREPEAKAFNGFYYGSQQHSEHSEGIRARYHEQEHEHHSYKEFVRSEPAKKDPAKKDSEPKEKAIRDKHRVPGSIGYAQDPGRVFKGANMAGKMGSSKPK
ncbi:hypothetical protein B0O99DRAFT_695416 [Bisporella sp. PMI_857]|nr:hypothetical protein B0O99DRAFT_695416 [Bisporella sp. PMI_857]